ncbi:NAD(P)H-binding protein [Lactococcus nasutitermitis]|uniref:NAD(P)H-binding protein n=1 Tax=Lactococcus nasutitermitis TaxID=1652957 RepID=A0ABV9JFW7_9LACT|nr:NAD(P)H-binding protein [Lactococcus nasutitermitis]
MKITLLGSIGNINTHTIPRLVADGHEVTVITSNENHISQIEALGARAAVGSMTDNNFLTQTFMGQDTVYLMISGTPSGEDMMQVAKEQATIFKSAIEQSDVKNVVNLSSVGAQDKNAGILYMYHFIEDALSSISNISLAIVRPVGFYSNLFSDMRTIKVQGTIFSNVPADIERAWTTPSDIAEQVYQFLIETPAGKTIKYVVSDWATGNDWIAALADNAISANYQLVTDDMVKQGLLAAGFSDKTATAFVEMSAAQRNPEPFYKNIKEIGYYQGQVKLTDFAKIFAKAYNTQA